MTDKLAPRRSIARLMWGVIVTALVLASLRTAVGLFCVALVGITLAFCMVPLSTAFALFLWLKATHRLDASTGRIRGGLHSLPSVLGAIASSLLGLVVGCLIGPASLVAIISVILDG
jgi:hypothetical protein